MRLIWMIYMQMVIFKCAIGYICKVICMQKPNLIHNILTNKFEQASMIQICYSQNCNSFYQLPVILFYITYFIDCNLQGPCILHINNRMNDTSCDSLFWHEIGRGVGYFPPFPCAPSWKKEEEEEAVLALTWFIACSSDLVK